MRYLVGLVAVGLFLCGSAGQEAKNAGSKKDSEVEIHFQNGSTVRMRIQSEKLEIMTIYGKLSVPVGDIRAIEFGVHMPEGHAEKIDAAVRQLAHGDFREREKGSAALLEFGPYSYGAAVEASRSKEAETAKRAKAVVEKLQAKFPKKDLKINADDKVITPTLPITGRIVSPNIKARADYFGVVELSLADMRSLRAVGGAGAELTVAVDASKYATRNAWLATDFQVDGRSTIVITAKGQIDLWPEEAGNYLAGPSGLRVAAAGGALGGGGFGGKKGVATKMAGGQLLGKIGEDGDVFVVGDRYEGIPNQTGILYLQITPSQYSPQPSGSYDVRATRKPD